MEEVQVVQVYRSDNVFSSLDGRTPSTEGLKYDSLAFLFAVTVAVRLSCLHKLLLHIWTSAVASEYFGLSWLIGIWFVKLITDDHKRSFQLQVYNNFVRVWNFELKP